MKRNILLLAVLAVSALANAQVASWLIPPAYDKIHKVIGADLLITDSLGETSLWTFEGKRIYKTKESLFSFK